MAAGLRHARGAGGHGRATGGEYGHGPCPCGAVTGCGRRAPREPRRPMPSIHHGASEKALGHVAIFITPPPHCGNPKKAENHFSVGVIWPYYSTAG